MNALALVARRYLLGRRRWRFISVLSAISVLGVSIGVTLLIVVLSVFNGFYGLVRDLLLGFDPHVRLVPAHGARLQALSRWIELARGGPDVLQVSPYVEGKALLLYGSRSGRVVFVRGLDSLPPMLAPSRTGELRGLFSPKTGPTGPGQLPPLLVGLSLASELGFFQGDTVFLLSASGFNAALQGWHWPTLQAFRVSGLYEIYRVLDQSRVFTSLQGAQALLGFADGEASGIELRLRDPDQAERVRRWLQERLQGEPVRVQTWYDLQRTLYEVMALEKWAAYVILSLIIGVAALNILGSLTMLVLEKHREIGALMAMGATRAQVRRLFLYAGFWIGLVGSGMGLLMGLGLCELQRRYGLVRLRGGEAFLIDAYPVRVEWMDVAVVVLGAWVLCLLAAGYPAWRAGRIWPAQALRYE